MKTLPTKKLASFNGPERGPDSVSRAVHASDSPCEDAAYTENIHRREYIIPTVFRAMVILKILTRRNRGLTVTEIHEETRFARTTIYRILRTLAFTNMLRQDVEGKYWASMTQPTPQDNGLASGR
ncbi:IclR helix-turn-helix domain-containing protein [Bryocella elongata]|uniref:IclR helix-turn-helix domain-containing protein n=1 Tax=Bryocella elongata TaxID=863522 RepID=A0A1H5XUW9_9BACT|nr:helix-turn-helix domain-containing protein [Bryocella elongata]SEG15453.1 IclR helix-turn-helix domain-containing protein [Bryocella elongata]